MKRSPLGIGQKSSDRGSTFEQRRSALTRVATKKKRTGISPASSAQRLKVRTRPSIVSHETGCDPAHVWPRGLGGCDDSLCVVPLTRDEHRAYDRGDLDLLPYLLACKLVPELQHALGHANGDLLGLLAIVTGVRWVPAGPVDPTWRDAA